MSVRLRASARTSAKSQHEEALARDLYLMSRREVDPWPGAVRELHPFWCCEHPKYKHHAGRRWPRPFCNACAVLDDLGVPMWPESAEHTYDKPRDFRVDFAYPAQRIAVEVEGIVWTGEGGRHQRGAGFAKDLAKYAALELAGWRVVRVGPAQVADGTAVTLIEAALKVRS